MKKEYISLIEAMSRLFGTSIYLQKTINTVNELIALAEPEVFELQHMRAELTALIGDLGDNQETFIKALAKAVDAKGQYSVAHSENTANLARKLSAELGLNEKTKDLIYYAGLLQNIGKITLPEELFSNRGKLSKEDWDKLKNYANIGVNILMKINFLSEVVPYICYHKERYDGSGEPEGLARMSIPLGSRIIAVADAYSAMTSDRAHRKAMSKEQALTIMKQEAGIKWDPIVVDALYDVVNQ
jgi:HD-GYP domain-containing protein (c-di-GMP phosphodiesterase class II)